MGGHEDVVAHQDDEGHMSLAAGGEGDEEDFDLHAGGGGGGSAAAGTAGAVEDAGDTGGDGDVQEDAAVIVGAAPRAVLLWTESRRMR